MAAADGAFVGVEHARRSAWMLSPFPGQIAGGVDRSAQQPVLLERGVEGVQPAARESLPTISEAVTWPYFSDAAKRSISSQCSAISSVLIRRVSSGPTLG